MQRIAAVVLMLGSTVRLEAAVEAFEVGLDELKPGEEKRYVRQVAVGSSPAAAVGVLLKAGGAVGTLSLTLRDGSGAAGAGAVVMIGSGGREVPS